MAAKKSNPGGGNEMMTYLLIGGAALAAYWYVTRYGPNGAVTDANGNAIPGAVSYWDTWFGGAKAVPALAVTTSAPAVTSGSGTGTQTQTQNQTPPAQLTSSTGVSETLTANPYPPGTSDWMSWMATHNGGISPVPTVVSTDTANATIQAVLKDYAFWQQMNSALVAKGMSPDNITTYLSVIHSVLNGGPPSDTTNYATAQMLEQTLLANIQANVPQVAQNTQGDPNNPNVPGSGNGAPPAPPRFQLDSAGNPVLISGGNAPGLQGIVPVTANRAGMGTADKGAMGMSFGGAWKPKKEWRN